MMNLSKLRVLSFWAETIKALVQVRVEVKLPSLTKFDKKRIFEKKFEKSLKKKIEKKTNEKKI